MFHACFALDKRGVCVLRSTVRTVELPTVRSLRSFHTPLAWVLFGKGGLHAWQQNRGICLLLCMPIDLGDCVFLQLTPIIFLCLRGSTKWVWGAWNRPRGRVFLFLSCGISGIFLCILAAATTYSAGPEPGLSWWPELSRGRGYGGSQG